MKRVASLWQEFKAFAFKGNMIDLAVAVVIGGAFSGVINSLVKDIIMPSISYVTTAAAEAGSKAADVAKSTASAVGVASKPAETQAAATQPAEAAAAAPPAPAPVPAVPLSPEMQQLKDMLVSIKNTPAPAPPPPPADAKPVDISWTIGRIKIGNFIGELINFVLIAAAVFIVIVKLLGSVMKRMNTSTPAEGPTTKECPFCLSVIPIKATKCAHCTADLVSAKPA